MRTINFENENLLVGGCSWTDQFQQPRYVKLLKEDEFRRKIHNGWKYMPRWYDNLNPKKVLNTGLSGASNKVQCDRIIDIITKGSLTSFMHKDFAPDRIILQLTDFNRIKVSGTKRSSIRYKDISLSRLSPFEGYIKDKKHEWSSLHKKTRLDIHKNLINDNIREIYLLASLCEYKKIPLHLFQAIPAINHVNKDIYYEILEYLENIFKSEIIKELLEYKYFNIMGWPLCWLPRCTELRKTEGSMNHFLSIAGKKSSPIINDLFIGAPPDEIINKFGIKDKSMIGKSENELKYNPKTEDPELDYYLCWDGHPNEKGHKFISDWIKKNIRII